MNKIIASILCSLIMTLGLLPFVLMSGTSNAAEPVVNCSQVAVDRDTVRINCTVAGILVAPIYIELPTVPPITLPPVEVEVPVPGETKTVTVEVPGQTITQTATETVTVAPEPGQTITKTAEPQNNSQTVTASPSGQAPSESATLEPVPEPSEPEDKEPIIKTIVEKAALGLLSIILLVIIVLFGMYLGYYIGYKDSDRANAMFMRALSDSILIRKR